MHFYPIIFSIWFKSKIVVPYHTKLYNETLTSFNAIKMNRAEFEALIKNNQPIDILIYETYYRCNKDVRTIVTDIKEKPSPQMHLTLQNNRISLWRFYQILAIYNIASKSFTSTPTFEKITFWMFLYFNIRNRIDANSYVIMIKIGNEFAGFLTYYTHNNNMYLKTIAILPKYQKLGLTTQLILESHRTAINLKFDGVYYINILQNNIVDAFPKDNAILVSKSYLLKYDHAKAL